MAEKRLEVGKVGLGGLIRDCVEDVNAWQRGGNTILGTVMLFVPMACRNDSDEGRLRFRFFCPAQKHRFSG